MKKIQLTFASLMLFVLTLSISIAPLLRVASAHDGDIPKLTYLRPSGSSGPMTHLEPRSRSLSMA